MRAKQDSRTKKGENFEDFCSLPFGCCTLLFKSTELVSKKGQQGRLVPTDHRAVKEENANNSSLPHHDQEISKKITHGTNTDHLKTKYSQDLGLD
jgi:hypothetical protein